MNKYDLSNKVAIVTGGAQGFGLAITKKFLDSGAEVIIWDIDKEACEKGDIVGILDALCDITYVSLGNGTMLHGLKGKIWKAYQEVQASNMSKSCDTEEEAKETVRVRSEEKKHKCHYEKVGDRYVVYRSSDRKVMKSIKYFAPNLKQFFTDEELKNI